MTKKHTIEDLLYISQKILASADLTGHICASVDAVGSTTNEQKFYALINVIFMVAQHSDMPEPMLIDIVSAVYALDKAADDQHSQKAAGIVKALFCRDQRQSRSGGTMRCGNVKPCKEHR